MSELLGSTQLMKLAIEVANEREKARSEAQEDAIWHAQAGARLREMTG